MSNEKPQYGHWQLVRSDVIFGVGWSVAVPMFLSVFVIIGSMFIFGPAVGLAVLFSVILIFFPLVFSANGRSGAELWRGASQWRKQRRRGQDVLRGGPLSRQPGGHNRMPGPMAQTTLHSAVDITGRPFAMVRMSSRDEYTVIFACSPQGDRNIEQEQINEWVGSWGFFLAHLGQSTDIAGATATIETYPDYGERLTAEVDLLCAMGAATAPKASQDILRESIPTAQQVTQAIECRLSITFRALTEGQREDPAVMGRELGRRIPDLYNHMRECGVECIPMTEGEVPVVAARSYDPAPHRQRELERALVETGEATAWEDAGPICSYELRGGKTLHHDGGLSRTWVLNEPPKGATHEKILKPLMQPRSEVIRKRLTLVYRPYSAGDASGVLDTELKNALSSQSTASGPVDPARRQRVRSAEQAREEENRGHGLTRFSILVTYTALTKAEFETGAAIVKSSLGPQSRLKLLPAKGQQAAAFAAGLGLGMNLTSHRTSAGKALWAKLIS
jgi:hypothetical protein